MLDRIFETKFDPATRSNHSLLEQNKSRHNGALPLSLLSLSLLAALSISNPAYADCTQDNTKPNKTVFHCSGEISDKDVDNLSKITGDVTIYNTGIIIGGDFAVEKISSHQTQNTELISTGGTLSGARFGGGKDTLTLFNTHIPNGASFDADFENEAPRSLEDTININQDFTLSLSGEGATLENWDIFNIGKEAKSHFIIDATDMGGAGAYKGSSVNIAPLGSMIYSSTVPHVTVHSNLMNEGIIDLSNASEHTRPVDGGKLVVNGNYEGKPGSKIFIKSLWTNPNPNLEASIIIDGEIKGETELVIKNNILDDISVATENKDGLIELPVVIVRNNTLYKLKDFYENVPNVTESNRPLPDNPVFTANAQTLGIRDAYLKRIGNKYHWSLKINGKDTISKPVVGYLQQPYINQQMMQEQLGKLHERIANLDNGLVEKQVWVRTNYDSTQLEGQDRFGADVKSSFIQIGGDIALSQSQDAQQRTGLMFTYGWANSEFSDQYKVEKDKIAADKFTGKARANMLSIGGYHTYYGKNGFYVDSVAQLSWLQNSYDSFGSKAKQNAWGLGASVEVGKAFPILNPKLSIEPQAQLTYQRIWFDGFTDGIKKVQQHSQDRLTARLGGRLIWTENINNKASQLYFSANLIQLLKGEETSIQVGRESISESYGKLAAEFGIGGEYPITPNLSLYANMRYAMGLQSSGSKSYKGHIGLNYRF